MSSILVTGTNGFIGRNLCKELLYRGWQVKGVVRSTSKNDLPVGVEPIEVETIDHVVQWGDILSKIDVVIHLAARVHILKEIEDNPIYEFRKINVLGTERLASASACAGVKRLIFISSIGVNGESTNGNFFLEEDSPNPSNAYALSKWEAEQVLHKVAQDTAKLDIVVLRPPLVYGMNAPGNFDRLIRLIKSGMPLPFNRLKNKRSLIYIDNLVDAIIKCIEHPDAANQTFLVSDGQDVSTPELIRMIARAMGKKAILFQCPVSLLKMAGKVSGKSAEVERLVNSLQIDSTKIRKTLNWTPPFTMEEGILETVRNIKL